MADILISNSENINNIQLKDQVSAPTTPSSGYKRLYVKANSLYFVDSSGVEHEIMEIGDLAANQTIDHSTVTLTAGIGLSGGGTIAANRTFDLDLNDLTTEASPATGDFIPIVDISESNALNKATIASILALATSTAPIVVGSYTGNGAATQAITGVGFQPKFLLVYSTATTSPYSLWFKMTADGTKSKYVYPSGTHVDDVIISLDSDGFTVGDSTGIGGGLGNEVNTNAVSYRYLALG